MRAETLPSIRFSSKRIVQASHTCSSPSTPLEPTAATESFQNASGGLPSSSEPVGLSRVHDSLDKFHSSSNIYSGDFDDVSVGEDVLATKDGFCGGTVAHNDQSDRKRRAPPDHFINFLHEGFSEETNKITGKMNYIQFASIITRLFHLPFRQNLLLILLLLVSLTIVFPGFVVGFLWGLYISFSAFLYFFVSEPKKLETHHRYIADKDELFASEREEILDNCVYKGWMNELIGDYDAASYHVNNSRTVLVRLEKNLLRISRPNRKVLKHAFHTDPTLSGAEPSMYEQSIHDLTNANINLRPQGLAKRRWWSRKYPIHIEVWPSSPISHKNEIIRKEKVEFSKVVNDDSRILQKSLSCESFHECKSDVSDNVPPCDSVNGGEATSKRKFASLKTKSQSINLFLFARSAREKERWFHLLREAIRRYHECTFNLDQSVSNTLKRCNRSIYSMQKESITIDDSMDFKRRFSLPLNSEKSFFSAPIVEYMQYINNYIQYNKCVLDLCNQKLSNKLKSISKTVNMDLGKNKWKAGHQDSDSQLVLSVNALASRIFFDFCRDPYWSLQVREKIQSKLATIHLPYFIEKLELSDLNLGQTSPTISSVYTPIFDEWGLWIDFEMNYKGGLHLVIETRVNLMKLKFGSLQQTHMEKSANVRSRSSYPHHYSDETLPESPESSADEEFGSKLDKTVTIKERTRTRILSVVDKIASSKYFQGASELKPVKKVMEEISSTRLMLHVDITCLEGTMTVNIPPPPSDRLWYAFRTPPRISIKSVPQVGDRCVDMVTISDWIESKLRLLLEKSLVCPNMDDVIVSAMSGNILLKSGYNQ